MNVRSHMKNWLLAVFILLPVTLAWGVTLPAGTPVVVALKADLSSENAQEGQRLEFEVAEPVSVNGIVVIPRGSLAWGGIQEFKAGGGRIRGRSKELKFDVEAVRLPDMHVIKLRTSREHKDYAVIKVTQDFGSGVGAPKGTTYTVYLDEDYQASGGTAPTATPAPTLAVSPANPTAARPGPAESEPTPVAANPPVVTPPQPPPATRPEPIVTVQPGTPEPPVPAVKQPAPTTTPMVAQLAHLPSATDLKIGPNTNWITVECFSTPAGAEILIDGVYFGNTQSIIKVPAGNHRLQFKLDGYTPYTVPLDIPPDSPVRTIRKDLVSLNPQ
jgi:PEGA domain